jgi:hypothetical protein
MSSISQEVAVSIGIFRCHIHFKWIIGFLCQSELGEGEACTIKEHLLDVLHLLTAGIIVDVLNEVIIDARVLAGVVTEVICEEACHFPAKVFCQFLLRRLNLSPGIFPVSTAVSNIELLIDDTVCIPLLPTLALSCTHTEGSGLCTKHCG